MRDIQGKKVGICDKLVMLDIAGSKSENFRHRVYDGGIWGKEGSNVRKHNKKGNVEIK